MLLAISLDSSDFLMSVIWRGWRSFWITSLWRILSRFRRENFVFPKPRGKNVAQPKVPLKIWKENIHSGDLPKGEEEVKVRHEWNYEIPDIGHLSVTMVGGVIHPGKAYSIHYEFTRQGVFTIKITPMGSNLVLLEGDKDDEDFSGFIEDAREWLSQWFKGVHPWKPTNVDSERVTWLFGVD